LKIAFVLPAYSAAPVGGFKVVYQFSNDLAARGHEVTVVHPLSWKPPGSRLEAWKLGREARRLRRDPRGLAPWMEIDPRVSMQVVTEPTPAALPAVDALVATSWHTAELVADTAGSRGIYLVQGFETWLGQEERVKATWRLPLRKVVISRWLEEIATEMGEGERTVYVPLGLPAGMWGVDSPLERRPVRVGVTFSPYKLSEQLIEALNLARSRVPDLAVAAFGTARRISTLPDWIDYRQQLTPSELRDLYNSCSIFLQANHTEGWGLPAAEAMSCGCALVTNDTGGSREYARDGVTARVVALDPVALGEAVAALARDEGRRLELARAGLERVGELTWDRSVDGFERVLAGESPAVGAA
jgi:glycosyltransferase involved in cell wall biosynthesis